MLSRASLVLLALATACGGEDADMDGWTVEAGDCNDNDNLVYPGGNEICDGIDNDCNDTIDDDYAAGGSVVYYVDADGDGFGSTDLTTLSCSPPEGYVENALDCKDSGEGAAGFNPLADELCDGQDQNCNGEIDEDAVDATAFHADWDQDGYGSSSVEVRACEAPLGYIEDARDCNDFDPFTNPEADEVCDYVDNNCDGTVDEDSAVDAREWFEDIDGDGFGNAEKPRMACWVPENHTDNNTDCNDASAAVNPAQPEICRDGLDNNCNDSADQCSFESWDSAGNATMSWKGESSSSYAGYDADFVGDVDGDGFEDLVVGAYYAYTGSNYGQGAGYLLYGNDTYSESSSPISILQDAKLSGAGRYNYFGYATGKAGDVDGDGYDDFMIGGYGGSSTYDYYGNAVLVYGSATRLSGSSSATDVGPEFEGQNRYEYFGGSTWGGADLDGDGYSEIFIGARGYSSYRGGVFMWSGDATQMSGSYKRSSADATFTGEGTSNYLGAYSGSIGGGDFDGDGNDDLLMGAYYAYTSSGRTGAAYLRYGDGTAPSGSASVSSLVKISGTSSYDYTGYGLGEVGDINNDGYQDMGIGCYYCNNGGTLYVFFGSATQMASVDQESADLQVINTGSSAYLAQNKPRAADLNGDGIDDLIVGSSRDTAGTGSYNGSIWVLAGGATVGGEYERDDVTKVIAGPNGSYQYFGSSVAVGDFNGDGLTDLVGGSYGAQSYAGQVFLFEGTSL